MLRFSQQTDGARTGETYRSGIFRLGGLSALLANGRQGHVQRRNVVRGKATGQVSTGIVGARGRGYVGADAAQRARKGSERRRFLAGGFDGAAVPNAGGKGHIVTNTLHASGQREFRPLRSRVWGCRGR
jgi:hypothetical protein